MPSPWPIDTVYAPTSYLSDLFNNGAGAIPIVNAMIEWAEHGANPLDVCNPNTLMYVCAESIRHATALGYLLGLLSW